jgi:hypothetical protein
MLRAVLRPHDRVHATCAVGEVDVHAHERVLVVRESNAEGEIFPSSVRGKCVAVATGANWFATWLVSQVFLSLVKVLGEPATFWRCGRERSPQFSTA